MTSPFPQIATATPQLNANVLVNEVFSSISHVGVYSYAYETSGGLVFGYRGGRWGGFAVAAGTFTLAASNTSYIVVARATGVPTASTSSANWSDPINYARVYKVVTGASSYDYATDVEDHREGAGGISFPSVASGGASGLEFAADTTTTDSDPGTGKLRWNNATQASATSLFIDNADADSTSLATIWASLLAGTFFKITEAANPDVWQLWKVNSAPINGTGYYKFPVTLQVQEGGNIANATAILLDIDASSASTFTGGTLTSALNEAPTVTIASSTTPAIFAAAANSISMTGTTTVTGFDTIAAGAVRRITFTGILQLTHNATSMINLSGANITTAAGDIAHFISLGSGNTQMLSYERASGASLVPFAGGTLTSALNEAPTVTIASSTTPAIGAAAGNSILMTGTTTITGFDTIAAGVMRRVRFGGALLLTYNATSLILPTSASITTVADDVAEFLSLGSGNWFCTSYSRKTGQPLVGDGFGAASAGVNAQTGTTYTVLTGDQAKLVTLSNASSIAVTLPQAGAGFLSGWSAILQNIGNGLVTITPTTSTIDGAATLKLRRGDAALIVSDGTNYSVVIDRRASRGVTVLTDGANIATDASLSDSFRVTLGGNRTLDNPTNLVDGQFLNYRIIQDGTGTRTLAYGNKFKFAGGTVPVLSTAASTRDFMSCQYDLTDDTLNCSMMRAFA